MGSLRWLASTLVVLSLACAGEADPIATTSPSEAGPTSTVSECAASMAEFLIEIEPIVVDFDPATMTLREFYEIEDATDEALDPDSTAAYTCESEGLSWASYSWESDWEEILSIAREHAPGTVPFMESFRRMVSLDEPALEGQPLPGCQEAAADLEQAIDVQISAGNEEILAVPFEEAIDIWFLTFATELGEGAPCVPDELRPKMDAFFLSPELGTTTSAP